MPQVVSSAIVDKYIGESARVIREMFGYAREHQPCVIFMDEIDAIGGKRFSEGERAVVLFRLVVLLHNVCLDIVTCAVNAVGGKRFSEDGVACTAYAQCALFFCSDMQ